MIGEPGVSSVPVDMSPPVWASNGWTELVKRRESRVLKAGL